jgi:hypothetical protein
MEEKISYYPIGGCPICSDMFQEFFIFCVQNKISYDFKKDVIVKLSKPGIKWGNTWYIGDEAFEKFREEWKTRMGKHAV